MNSITTPQYSPATPWSGRDDGDGIEHQRWHNLVKPLDLSHNDAEIPKQSIAILGFASDEGVARNAGRQGAAKGPEAIRASLGSLAVHPGELPDDIFDAGTIATEGDNLESAHTQLIQTVQRISAENLVFVLGGGHETAYGSHLGLQASQKFPVKIINLDAHFDLRTSNIPTSGTPFRQIADHYLNIQDQGSNFSFDYSVLGISRANNTKILFDTADELGVEYVLDDELLNVSPHEIHGLVERLISGSPTSLIHLSIDLDVLPASTAPGVSAPAALGVPLTTIRAIAVEIAKSGRLALVDIVELNPKFDVDSRTAKTAARLINDLAIAHHAAIKA
ncbi:formimidoylglutamase [uncultured Corynebacterium sp.]|uniref:formimidoylglutamase n=1 Tax=uncultured Corynebacterium sp. TaxID=159447 RepID=UPI0025E80329|nr:formimidoylglutamase [uncultured Corynebacterium sp.]